MKKQGWYELVEPRTLFNSILPLLLGIMYAWYNFKHFNLLETIEMIIATLILQIVLNINDGYWDYKRAKKLKLKEALENPIGKYHLNMVTVKWVDITLFAISMINAFLIGFQTNWIIWIIGIIGYWIAISYSTGSHPMSGSPFSEFAAGLAMGLGIFIVMIYINVHGLVPFNWSFAWPIIVASGIGYICNFNVMLANNLCDRNEDIAHGRHTLVFYIGIKSSLYLLSFNYLLGFIATIYAIYLHVMPISVLLILITIPLIIKNMRYAWHVQSKATTFPRIIKITHALCYTELIGFLIGIFFKL